MKKLIAFVLGYILIINAYAKNYKNFLDENFAVFNDLIAFVIIHSDSSSIYVYNHKTGEELFKQTSNKNHFFQSPEFSIDGNKLISPRIEKNKSCILEIDIKKKHGKEVYCTEKIINHAIFNRDSNELIVSMARWYGKYSPVGPKMPHDNDIYLLNIIDGKIKNLTNDSYYSPMYNLMLSEKQNVITFKKMGLVYDLNILNGGITERTDLNDFIHGFRVSNFKTNNECNKHFYSQKNRKGNIEIFLVSKNLKLPQKILENTSTVSSLEISNNCKEMFYYEKPFWPERYDIKYLHRLNISNSTGDNPNIKAIDEFIKSQDIDSVKIQKQIAKDSGWNSAINVDLNLNSLEYIRINMATREYFQFPFKYLTMESTSITSLAFMKDKDNWRVSMNGILFLATSPLVLFGGPSNPLFFVILSPHLLTNFRIHIPVVRRYFSFYFGQNTDYFLFSKGKAIFTESKAGIALRIKNPGIKFEVCKPWTNAYLQSNDPYISINLNYSFPGKVNLF